MRGQAYGPEANGPKVLICGTLFPFSEKAPFTPSGLSVRGALEINPSETTLKCHECANSYRWLTPGHLRTHGLSPREYRIKHGLKMGTALVAPATASHWRDASRARAVSQGQIECFLKGARTLAAKKRQGLWRPTERRAVDENRNLRMRCRAQLVVRLTNLAAKLGHSPTARELACGDQFGKIYYRTVAWAFGMTLREAFRSIGLTPNKRGIQRIAAPTELAILQMRVKGFTFAEIARRLNVSETTAANYSKRGIARSAE